MLKKENEIMKRHLILKSRNILSNHPDRLCLSLIAALSKSAISHLTIVKPETLLGKRFYLLIILELKTRMIIRYDLTENPCREFVKRWIELFTEKIPDKKTLIYDNAPQFTSITYSWYDIKGVNIYTSAPKAGRK